MPSCTLAAAHSASTTRTIHSRTALLSGPRNRRPPLMDARELRRPHGGVPKLLVAHPPRAQDGMGGAGADLPAGFTTRVGSGGGLRTPTAPENASKYSRRVTGSSPTTLYTPAGASSAATDALATSSVWIDDT